MRRKKHSEKFSFDPRRLSNDILYRFVCVFLLLAFLVIIVSAVAIGNSDSSGGVSKSKPLDTLDTPSFATTSKTLQNSEISYGDLILVNNSYACAYDNPQLVSMLEQTAYSYTVADYDVKMESTVFTFADRLLGDFETQNGGSSDILVSCAYRSKQVQQQLYDAKTESDGAEETAKWIAKPGCSEHQTGMAFDLSLMIDGITYEYTGEGEYAWLNQNCYKYGFIVRYPIAKSSITSIEHEPWHFRYVGQPHAEYMYKNDLCLEEYIELLHKTSISDPLRIASETGNYAVYYVEANKSDVQTSITVPEKLEYTISGDNIDGFFVTVKLA